MKLSLNYSDKHFYDVNPYANSTFVEPFSNILISFLLWTNILNLDNFNFESSASNVETQYYSILQTFIGSDVENLPLQIFFEHHVKFLLQLIPTCRQKLNNIYESKTPSKDHTYNFLAFKENWKNKGEKKNEK